MSSIKTIQVGSNERLRPKEAAQEAHTSVGMIYRWIHEGRFKSWTVKRQGFERGVRYIDRRSFENFLNSQVQEVTA